MQGQVGAGAAPQRSAPRGGGGGGGKKSKPLSGSGGASRAPSSGGGGAGILRFYTDDTAGLKIQPPVVLVVSLLFVGFVILLHLWGKFHRG